MYVPAGMTKKLALPDSDKSIPRVPVTSIASTEYILDTFLSNRPPDTHTTVPAVPFLIAAHKQHRQRAANNGGGASVRGGASTVPTTRLL